uniref:BEACH domain-containing protein n=1 Tax=Aureoumbra lagunensis TaxID=44058 RepID=A0A6S8EIJ7_9STRA
MLHHRQQEQSQLRPKMLLPLELPRCRPPEDEISFASIRKARLDALADITRRLYASSDHHSPAQPMPSLLQKFRNDVLNFVTTNDDDQAVGCLVDAIVAVCVDDDDALAPLLMERVIRSRLDRGDSDSVVALARLLKKTKRHRLFADALRHTKARVADAVYTAFLDACVEEDPLLLLDVTATLLIADRLGIRAVGDFTQFVLTRAKNIAKPGLTSRAFDAAYLALVARSLRHKKKKIHFDNEATYQLLLSSLRCARTEALNNEPQAFELAAALADESGNPSTLLKLIEEVSTEFNVNQDLRSNILNALPILVAIAPRFKHVKELEKEVYAEKKEENTPSEEEEDGCNEQVIQVLVETKDILKDDEENNTIQVSSLNIETTGEEEDEEDAQSQDSLAVASLEVTGQAEFFETDEDDDDEDVQIVKVEIAHSQVDDLRLAVSIADMCRALFSDRKIKNLKAWDAALCVVTYLVKKRNYVDDAQLLSDLLRQVAAIYPDESGLGRRALVALDAAHTALRDLKVLTTTSDHDRLVHADELYAILIEGARLIVTYSRSSHRNKLLIPRAAMDALIAMLADAARVPSSSAKDVPLFPEDEDEDDDDEFSSCESSSSPAKAQVKSSWMLRSKSRRGKIEQATSPVSKCEKLLDGLEGRGCRHSWLASQWLADDLATALAAVDPRADSTAWSDAQADDTRTAALVRTHLRNALANARRLGEPSWVATCNKTEENEHCIFITSDRSDRAWRACAKLVRAEWSPWCADEPSTVHRYRIAVNVDRLGRRPILERDFEPRDFTEAAYSSRHQRALDEMTEIPSNRDDDTRSNPPISPQKAEENLQHYDSNDEEEEDDNHQPGGSFVVVETSLTNGNIQKKNSSQKKLMTAADARKHVDDLETRRRWEPLLRFSNTLLVLPSTTVEGTLKVTRYALIFESASITRTVRLVSIERLSPRRYLLQHRAIEIWRANHTSMLLVLKSTEYSKELWSGLTQLWRRGSLPLIQTETFPMIDQDALDESIPVRHIAGSTSDFTPSKFLPLATSVDEVVNRHLSKLTDAWKKRKISNFVYIAALNDLAGRNYADIAQWPIFPWVLADFESDRDTFLGLARTKERHLSADHNKRSTTRKRTMSSSSWIRTSSSSEIETDEASRREEEIFFGITEASTTAIVQSSQQTVFQGSLSPRRRKTMIRDRFRDLSKPMGAHGPQSRVEAFEERYRSFEDPSGDVPKFMFGSHYSSAAIVVHYLVRVEPFAELAVQLQGKTFDVPDRLFHSVCESWKSATESMCDVKELVPEMFYLPEMFLNQNALPLGARQRPVATKEQEDIALYAVDNVALPAWSQNDAHEFVRLHRLALESDYVSNHLHNWIDLIFGVKQRGPRAVAATNVFYHLTYENAVDVDAIQDNDSKTATLEQIKHFGQTPPQIFSAPHPTRLPATACPLPLFGPTREVNFRDTKVVSARESIRVYKVPSPPQLPDSLGLPYGELLGRSTVSAGLFGDIRRAFGGNSSSTNRDSFTGVSTNFSSSKKSKAWCCSCSCDCFTTDTNRIINSNFCHGSQGSHCC